MKSVTSQQTRSLIVVCALIVGALTISRLHGYFVVDREIVEAVQIETISNLANKQHLLAQATVQHASKEAVDFQTLQTTRDDLEKTRGELSKATAGDPRLTALLETVDASALRIRRVADSIVAQEGRKPSKAQVTGLTEALASLYAANSKLESNLHELEMKSLAETQRLRRNSLIVGLSILAIVAYLVISPLRKWLTSFVIWAYHTRQNAEQQLEALGFQAQELESTNVGLKERILRLRESYEESKAENYILSLASSRFEDLFHGAPFACFSVDQSGLVFEWNFAASHMFGAEAHEIVQRPIYGRFFGKDNDLVLKEHVLEAFAGNSVSNIELVTSKEGEDLYLLMSVFPLRAGRKQPTAALIACADITLQKQAETEALQANEKVAAILNSINDAFVTLDYDLVYRYVNNTASEMICLPPGQIIGRKLEDVANPLSGHELRRQIQTVLETGEDARFEQHTESTDAWFEVRAYRSVEGVSLFFTNITARKRDEETIHHQRTELESAMLRLHESSIDLAEQQLVLEVANRELKKLATTDGLTGLLNHRSMQEELILAGRRSEVRRSDLAVALIDVDFFKKFNDSFGHQEGDKVLRKVAGILQDSVRDPDIVARYGGEEFCVILPGASDSDTLIVCERIRKNIESSQWEQRNVTVSVGVATAKDGKNVQDLIRLADQALYEAKGAGRNRVSMYGAPIEESA